VGSSPGESAKVGQRHRSVDGNRIALRERRDRRIGVAKGLDVRLLGGAIGGEDRMRDRLEGVADRIDEARRTLRFRFRGQFLDLFPVSNGADNGDGTGDLITANKGATAQHHGMIRLDHNFSDTHSLLARYIIDDSSAVVPYFGTPPGTYVPGFPALHEARNQYFTAQDRRNLGPDVFNELRFGINRTTASTSIVDTHPGLSISLVPGRPFGPR
jgi:hypothetical protein